MYTDDLKMRIQVTPKSLYIFRSLPTVESIKLFVRQWIKHCPRFLRILKSSKLHVLNFTWLACHAYTVDTADTQIWGRMNGIFVRHAVKFCLNGTCLLVTQHTLWCECRQNSLYQKVHKYSLTASDSSFRTFFIICSLKPWPCQSTVQIFECWYIRLEDVLSHSQSPMTPVQ